MRNNKHSLLLTLFFLIALAIVAGSLKGQEQRDKQSERLIRQRQEALKKIDAEYPIVAYDAPGPAELEERAKRRAKSKRHNRRRPRIGPGVDTVEIYHWPSGFSAIPIKESTAIIIGHVTDAQAYLSSDKSGVYSEFNVIVERVLKGDSANIQSNSTIQVERIGGRVLFPSGLISRLILSGLGMPRIGYRYVLFLKRLDVESGESVFEIQTAYHLQSGHVEPIDDSPRFEEYRGTDELGFLNEILKLVAMDAQAKG